MEALPGKAIRRQNSFDRIKLGMAAQELLKLKALKPGSKIGIIAPASPAHPELVERGVNKLEGLGFELISPLDPSKRFENLGKNLSSASAADRAAAFMGLIEREDCAMILAVRGGYGSVEMLPQLDFKKIRQARKPIAGYSDITALLSAVYKHSGIPTIHGPSLAAEFACANPVKGGEDLVSQEAQISCNSLIEMLQGKETAPYEVETVVKGEAEGRLIVGNLSIFQTLLGTDWDPDFTDAILLIEDVGEAPYRIHRILTHLRQAGKFSGIRGLVYGRFSKCVAEHGPDVDQVMEEIFSPLGVPVARTNCFGHNGLNMALPLGCQARLEGESLELLEGPVQGPVQEPVQGQV